MTQTQEASDDFPTNFKYPAQKPKPTIRTKRSKPQGRGTSDKTRPADWVDHTAQKVPVAPTGNGRVPPYTENNVPKDTPNTLETAFTGETNSLRNIHESLELLVEGHIKEAEGIMGRTVLISTEDAHTISDVMFRAKHGIGGKLFSKPQPWLSAWMLDKLKSLPSVQGRSRKDFVDAWKNSSEERHQRQKQLDDERKRLIGGS